MTRKILILSLVAAVSLVLLSASAWASSPIVYYSDLTSGPGTGGQNNEGVFVTIWGNNFGSSQGSSAVTVGGGAVYGYETWTNTEICFQIGSLAKTGNIVVTTSGGTSNGIPFSVRSGNIYFVNPAASTNGTGTYASPFNHLYYSYNIQTAGDTTYVETGTITDEINGYAGWHGIMVEDKSGTQTNPIAWVAYPNNTVTLIADGSAPTWSNGTTGSGGESQTSYIFRADGSSWVTISKFYMSFTGSNANLQSEVSAGAGWRVIGNNLTATYYTDDQIDFSGGNVEVLGNEVHDSGSGFVETENEMHSIYAGGANNPFEIGWNYMHGNINMGWEIQSYHNGPRIGTIHDNLIIAGSAGSDKGILQGGAFDNGDDITTTWTNNVKIYNNIVINAGQSSNGGAIQVNCGTAYIYNNTIYYSGTEKEGVIQFPYYACGPNGGDPVWYVANNIIQANNSGLYLSDENGNAPKWSDFALLSNNNYYGEGNGPTQDANAINANPQFVSPNTAIGGNFQLQSASPDINAGYNTNSIVATDINGLIRSTTPAIGAYEYTSASSTPVVAITSPAGGSSVTSGSNISITAVASETNGSITNIALYSGATLLGSSSSSPYTYVMNNPAVGNYTLTAVATDAKGVSTTSSAVSVTVSSQIVSSSPVVAITSPANASSYTAGSNVTITTTASETNGTISNISLYNGSGLLLGSSSTSPYNFVDSNMAAGGYSFYAVATDVNGVSTTSGTVSITVTPASSPVVTIASPANGTTFTQGSMFTITANASESNGTITQVQYYSGSYLLATATSSPYTASWSNATTGTFTINAKATDANGVSTMSSPITVTVAAASSSPVVSLTSPANSSSYTAGANITLTASASETNGTIASVKFYNGSTLLGTSTSSPYTFSWTNVAAGNYSLTAKATDANGNSTTSSAAAVTVSGLPAISLSANNTSFTAPAVITLTASASEANGTISKVEFFNGSALLGTVTSSPYTYTWSNVGTGNYNLTAEAFDNNNNTATSSTVAVTVTLQGVAPSFTLQPVSQTVTVPAAATFSVAATGTPAPTFQWMQSVNGGAFSNIAGATSASYTTAATTTANSGTQFECVVSNASGSVTSNIATLTVNPAPVAPSFTLQPVSLTVTAPATATFSVAATGTPAPTFQWMQSVNGGAFSNIAGATSASYTTAATTTANSGTQFECVVSNASGSVTSNIATLTVKPTPVAPSFTLQPVSQTVTAPAAATFSVAATGTPAPTFQWMQSVNGGAFSNIAGATSASYTTAATTTANSGTQFECVVSNASGSVTSNIATLTVNPAPVAPSFTLQPVSLTVTAPATATFSVAATGTPAPTFQWMQSVNGGAFSNIAGATSASYTTAATTTANSGTQFECVVSNASGSVTSNAATLTVNAAPSLPTIILTSPTSSSTFTYPANIFISANASETNGNITQVQFFNGSNLLYTATSNPFNYTWSTYLMPGNYTITAQATDSRGVVVTSAPATITIGLPNRMGSNPWGLSASITSPNSASSFSAGSTIAITANASENNGSIAQVYFYNGSSYLGSSSAAPYNFTWANVPAGNYSLTAVAIDATGHSVTSNTVTVTVNGSTPPAPAVSIINPTNGNKFTKGANFTITANAFEIAGTGSLYASKATPTITQVQFYSGSTLLGTSTISPYTFAWSNVPAGTYSLVATATDSNGVTSSSSPVSVTVVAPSLPVAAITSPSNGSSLIAGSTLSITASTSETNGTIAQVQFFSGSTLLGTSSASPYTYNWSNIPAGSYSLTAVATDSIGVSTTSAIVTVTVNPSLPVASITSPANDSSITAGSSLTITANASEAYGSIASVKFYNGSTLLGTDITAPYSLTWINVPAGSYSLTVVATDANGVSSTSTAVTVSVNLPLPTAAITSPASGSSLTAGSNLTINASASEINGTIAQVQFYNGSTLLGTSTSAPYSYTWNNVPAGTYSLTVVATDSNGVSTKSSAVPVTANTPAPVSTPEVTITSLANGSNLLIGSTVNIAVSASDSNAAINQINIFNGSMLLYTVYGTTNANYNWRTPLPGKYTLTAQAIDSNGNVIVSTPVNVSVVL